MPIRPDQLPLYPFDWRQLSWSVRYRRARGRCERCGRPDAVHVPQLANGLWWDEGAHAWRDGRGKRRRVPAPHALLAMAPPFAGFEPRAPWRLARVRLAAAHLDHDPGNNAGANLAALCGRCHLAHDAPEHRRQRARTLRARRAAGDLFASRL